MLIRGFLIVSAVVLALSTTTTVAMADACSGHSHTTGTVVGAVGGGLIGSALTHGNAVGVVGGAVAGGLAGNAIARNGDCYYDRRRREHYYYDHHHHRHYVRGEDRYEDRGPHD
ncbi:MAG: glycine zipper 2TM domain-containing protein [Alphaproteobacteria bacterium]|nr:glycine zipper 2TM domain-containing protein [Alphaproteobacteria bacterium]MDE2492848.1 glycine zipper 2TM domain-containing protein [Alphaproteobacteria bacterium]